MSRLHMHSFSHGEPVSDRHHVAHRTTWVSVWVNVFLTTIQIVIGFFAASQSLIADGIHSLSDLFSDGVVLLVNRRSKKAADHDHQYGHLRYENAATFVLGLLLLGISGGMLFSAAQKIYYSAAIPQVQIVALWVALGAIVIKELLFRYMLLAAESIRSSMLIANAWHARSDALSSLVAAVGIVGNLLGYTFLDPLAAVIVGLMIIRMGWTFSWNALGDLMDRAISPEEYESIYQTILDTPGVLGVHDMRTRRVGDFIIVDVHLELDAALTIQVGHDIADLATQRVIGAHPSVLEVMTHMDPVVRSV